MLTSHQIGLLSEERSCRYLVEQGFTILARRFKTKYGEIDIIANRGSLVVFFEIKHRKTIDGHCIAPRQQRRIVDTAKLWLAEHEYAFSDISFDVILTTPSSLVHLRSVFGDY